MKRTGWMVFGWALVLLPPVFLALCGCEVGSADSVVRMVAVDFSGFYQGTGSNGTQMVSPANSGDEVTLLNLRQNGDQLEAIDNNGIVFRGTLGNLVDTTASFTLEGRTTVGRSVTISGTLSGEGTDGTMRGTWIEPNQYSTLYAEAVINPSPTNNPVGTYTLTVTINPSGAGSVSPSGGSYSNGAVVTLQATASTGFSFSSWSGDLSGSSNPTTITMTGDKSVTANFQ
ncbi:MAG: hypothetical protein KA248_08235 [Kiritimatiellae bacterium]|nr:hypothetical protein [Kiritimatiellia bacterium]